MRTGSRAFLAPARPGPAALLCSQVLCPPAERPPAEADTWLGPAVGPAQGLLRSSVSASASAGLTPGVNLVRWVQGGGVSLEEQHRLSHQRCSPLSVPRHRS